MILQSNLVSLDEPRPNPFSLEMAVGLPTDFVITDTRRFLDAYVAGTDTYLIPEITDFLEGHTIGYIDLVQRCNRVLNPFGYNPNTTGNSHNSTITPDMLASYEKARIIMSSIPEIEWEDIPLPAPILRKTLFAPPKTPRDFAWRMLEMRREIAEVVRGETPPGAWVNMARDIPLLRTVAFFKTGDSIPIHLA